jgi:S-adenosylmethionine:tRNA ribosyltransferase-isomerase
VITDLAVKNSDTLVMLDLEQYNYYLPPELIRKQGVEPRDSARLFVYDTKQDAITHATFLELAHFLPTRALMVLNNTKVVPARLHLKKETGGKIEVFVLANEIHPLPTSPLAGGGATGEIPVLVDRKCLPGWKLYFPNGEYFEVVRQEENIFYVKLFSHLSSDPLPTSPLAGGEDSLARLLEKYGETPIPHYLEESEKNETALRKRYQTIFAQAGASVAAPTASLHFTERVFESLNKKEIERTEVTLNVGLGTFAPLKEEHFESGKLHSETVTVSEEAAEKINRVKQEGSPVVAVGTTAIRTLETAVQDHEVKAFAGTTDIFIYPPYRFRVADILLTNFHLPKSSLMLLVDAFLEHKGAKRRILDLYQEAIREGYAFYSFGDSMLML